MTRLMLPSRAHGTSSRRRGRTSRTLTSAVAVVAATAMVAASCTTGPVGEDTDTGDDDAATSEQFPRTVSHNYGETVIESEPQRVATVSWVNADVLLSLGVVPVGMPTNDFGANEQGSTDWFDEALADVGGEMPETYSETDGINAEAIAATDPDLIVGAYSGMTEEEYEELSRIAPVIPMPEGDAPFGTSWQDATTLVGEAMGLEDEAEGVISDVEQQMADYAEQNPALDGATFLYGTIDPAAADQISLYTSIDTRPRFLSALGMEQAPAVVEAEAEVPDQFFVTVSPERADELEADVLITWAADENVVDAIAEDPLLGQIPAVADGHVVAQVDEQETLSLSAASPLSLSWALENVVPDITATVEQARG